jgi:hypothetical protein
LTDQGDFITLKYSDDSNSIVIFSLKNKTPQRVTLPDEENLPLKAICGPYNDIYFVSQHDTDDYSINCISFTGSELTPVKVEQVFQNQHEIKSI